MILAHCRIRLPGGLSSLRDVASNHTAYNTLLIMDCKSAYYVDILMLLGGSVFRQGPELWVKLRYMKLCVDRDLNCG